MRDLDRNDPEIRIAQALDLLRNLREHYSPGNFLYDNLGRIEQTLTGETEEIRQARAEERERIAEYADKHAAAYRAEAEGFRRWGPQNPYDRIRADNYQFASEKMSAFSCYVRSLKT